MNWLLFIQIEIMMLTVGLVVAFVAAFVRNGKDISWSRRAGLIGDALAKAGKEMAEQKANENQKMFAEFLKTLSAKKEEKKDEQ